MVLQEYIVAPLFLQAVMALSAAAARGSDPAARVGVVSLQVGLSWPCWIRTRYRWECQVLLRHVCAVLNIDLDEQLVAESHLKRLRALMRLHRQVDVRGCGECCTRRSLASDHLEEGKEQALLGKSVWMDYFNGRFRPPTPPERICNQLYCLDFDKRPA
jgi:hypothetical protein